MFTRDDVLDLAAARPGRVLSIYARTDPRDPANTGHAPAWHTEARNGLRDVVAAAEGAGDRDDALAIRDLAKQVEDDLAAVTPADRGRSFAWFLTPDGSFERRFTFQLPVRRTAVTWDDSPLVAPLADLGDRGRATDLVLVGLDAVRVLTWETGHVIESDRSEFGLDTGDWRRYQRGVGRGGGRGAHAADQREAFDARVEANRERFFAAAAAALGPRMAEDGVAHAIVTGGAQVASRFVASLPNDVAARVLATVETDLVDAAPALVAERLEPEIERARSREIAAVAEQAASAAAGGRHGAVGPADTMLALAERRVSHLVVDPQARPADGEALDDRVTAALDGLPLALFGERAIELALEQDARVSVVDSADEGAPAGGMAALLRF